ncbi:MULTISPECIES: PTS lactose/cellobiose transporter subunit IIA [Clostridium]|uniref:PTS system cellobiose-specific EIIA component n=2 Tax=Clostridium TaxID=1485 RepID=A0A6V8SS88_9CLOT|nr:MULTISPECIES: PTS lactose/cellobiose transporter subunit IIA [Clostridium]GFP77763.1 PTS system cellobiose-specific EIIA component [Clostridium fungisolvens]GKU26221.1 PTS mannose transporter subunit IIA [Clostridium folliculivorans]GKU31893.1 PTS mannose transporter subunit IIA [Clostridium folliculivorans]
MNELEMIVLDIIVNAGDAKAYAYEALDKVNKGQYHEAEEMMEKANHALSLAHNVQTDLLQREAAGERTEISVLFVHAQDHLMTSISEKNLIEQIIELRKVVNNLINNQVQLSHI